MASISAILLLLLLSFSSTSFSASVIEDLNNLHPPPGFNLTIIKNCLHNPSLRYCNSSPQDLNLIFKFTIVASHLCNQSNNPNCVESFPKIDLRDRPEAAPLYLSFDFFWKYCPLDIIAIDISNSSLEGPFPTDILLCTQVRVLDLSHNRLSGDVLAQSFSALTNLTLLNLSYNHFTEYKNSDAQFFKKFNSSCFVGSGLIPDHSKFKIKAVVLLVGFPILVVLAVGGLGWLCLRRPDYLPKVLQRRHRFTPAMLRAATNGLSRRNLVARSEGVDIYKGFLRDGSEVRIEIYWDTISRQDCRKFLAECKVLAQLCHKNIVRVLGWSNARSLRAIVTEWTDGETIEGWLSEKAPSWKQRLKVLMGVVEGMCYLQEQWPEVGYDLRTSSVLLSNDQKPMISRFRIGDHNSSSRRTYRLGILILEMIVNRRSSEEFERGEAGFIDYIRKHYPGNLIKVIDQRMEMTEVMFEHTKRGVHLGLMCTDQSSNHPPRLDQIHYVISEAYECCLVSAPAATNRRLHGDRGKGHKRIQTR